MTKHTPACLAAIVIASFTMTALASPQSYEHCVQITVKNDIEKGGFSVNGDVCHPHVFANGYVQNDFLLVPGDSLQRWYKINSALSFVDSWGNMMGPSIYLRHNMTITCSRNALGAQCLPY